MAKDLPMDPRIPGQSAKATIKNLVDGVVELVTNSDDSYLRLEEDGYEVSGKIEIRIVRKKGGLDGKLIVKDFAEGMTREKMERAIGFGAATSGLEEGKSVRGLWGRGLKEAILALGKGEIQTVKDGQLTRTKIWTDKKSKKSKYDDDLLLKSESVPGSNGTQVSIDITNDRIQVPEYANFKEQLCNHYAVRDINSSTDRRITLVFEDKRKGRYESDLRFSYPKGERVLSEEKKLPNFGDRVRITIYESAEPLKSPRNNPRGLAGILIKTKSAILENQLFNLHRESAALYFYGEAICLDLEERLRKGETELLDFNRGGLEWQQPYCNALWQTIEEALEPHVLRKKQELQSTPKREVPKSTRRMLEKLRKLLNDLAKSELEDIPEAPVEPPDDITTLVIRPGRANAPENKPRPLSIYAPKDLVEREGKEVRIESDNADITPLTSKVKLERHPEFGDKIWYRYFKVVGRRQGAQGRITVRLGKESDSAIVTVAPFKKRKKGQVRGKKRGFISDIVHDETANPSQRASYEEGVIKIFTRFPSVSKFIQSGFKGAESPEGRMLMSELVGEAFCQNLARERMDRGYFTSPPGGEVDSFNNEINELQKRHLHKIQEIMFAWRFK